MPEELNRRELKSRQSSLAQKTAQWLSSKSITPNQISIMSVIFSIIGALFLYFHLNSTSSIAWAFPLFTALFIQCRLLCNLFDGMVAVEGGKGTPAGELFNDIPDRVADAALFIAAGYSISSLNEFSIPLGWATALFAVLTAYIRTLATAIGAPTNFAGPMAKQHRMFTLTFACVLTSALSFTSLLTSGSVLFSALLIICLGSIITCIRRAIKAYSYLENQNV